MFSSIYIFFCCITFSRFFVTKGNHFSIEHSLKNLQFSGSRSRPIDDDLSVSPPPPKGFTALRRSFSKALGLSHQPQVIASSSVDDHKNGNPAHLRKLKHSFSIDKLFNAGGSNKKKRVLILMSDTGGGHRASAQAIDQAMTEIYPGKIEVSVMDIWTDFAKYPFNTFVPTYRFLAKHPPLWRGFYAYGQFPPTKLFTEIWSKMTCYDSFRKAIVTSDPDLVVSVHPLCQAMPISIVSEMNAKRSKSLPKIPFVTVVTDLGGAHPTWFDKRADLLYVPSDAVKKIALKNGIDERKIVMKGLPVRPSFWKASKSKETVRKQLGLRDKLKTVLLMGGGDGVGGLNTIAVEVAKRLGKSKTSSQLVVICGHNANAQKELQAHDWPKNMAVDVKGFVTNVDEYMVASDCLITKAGPGTIAEAMIRGVPLILSSFLPGQEAGNVPYVVNGGFGVYTGNHPKKIASAVYNLFHDPMLLESMISKAKALSRPDATLSIARDIGQITLSGKDAKLSS